MKTVTARPSTLGLELPKTSLKPRRPAVSLWRPEIVLARSIDQAPGRASVTLATPASGPEAVRTQLESARTLADQLADARQSFGAQAAAARGRAEHASCERERVTATMEAYRAEAALDDVLTGTFREVSALMERRGLR